MKFADKLILDTAEIVSIYKEYLEVNWLFTVDISSLISIIVSCYYFPPLANQELEKVLNNLDREFFEIKSAVNDLQFEFAQLIVKRLARTIDEYLTDIGIQQYEYFPYEFERLLPDGAIVLNKYKPY